MNNRIRNSENRIRNSDEEKWTVRDMAYRPGGLPQPTGLERVIAEQQEKIDWLTGDLKRAHETSETLWTRHNGLFEAIARLLDYDLPIDPTEQHWTQFSKLRHAVRMQMLDTGYCLHCYNFVCECDYD